MHSLNQQYEQSLLWYFPYIFRVALKLRKLCPSVIHVFQTFPLCYWLKLFCPCSMVVYHVSWHGLSLDQDYYGHKRISNAVANMVLPKVDRIIAVSNYLAHSIKARFPLVKDKIFVAHRGVDPDIYRSIWMGFENGYNNSKKILFVGRITPEKGLHILIPAFSKALLYEKDANLTICGTYFGPGDLESYKKKIERLVAPNSNSIKFTGWVLAQNLPKHYSDCSICVHPAIWEEPFANVPLKAMSTGLPVIASNTGGTSELITHRENGFLVQPADVDALANLLIEVLLDPDLRQKIGREARKTVERDFSWEHSIRAIISSCYPHNMVS